MVEGWYKPSNARVEHYFKPGSSPNKLVSICGDREVLAIGMDEYFHAEPFAGVCKKCYQKLDEAAGGQ
jgi:hypothetical protein